MPAPKPRTRRFTSKAGAKSAANDAYVKGTFTKRKPSTRQTQPKAVRPLGGLKTSGRSGAVAGAPARKTAKSIAEGVRLQKILSHAGVSSRRVAEELIRQGRIEVNGKVASELGTRANPEVDDIRVDGRRLKLGGDRKYYLMYKPRGVVSTRSDPQQRETVIEVLAKAGVKGYFYPVGRLDYDSEGLIIMTNDGDLAEKVTHPKHELERSYEVRVSGLPDTRDLERLARGIVIEGRRTLPAQVRVVRTYPDKSEPQALIEIIIKEGRNRQIRRMFDGTGHPVIELRRTRIGPITDRRIKPGQVRELTTDEIKALFSERK
jgi:23S rRNA pseudouridine2605 synthase